MDKSGKKPQAPVMRFKPGTIRRLLGYMSQYRVRLIFVVICILVSAFSNAASALFLQRLIDDYISPLLLDSGGTVAIPRAWVASFKHAWGSFWLEEG